MTGAALAGRATGRGRASRVAGLASSLAALVVVALAGAARAGIADTPPQGAVIFDSTYGSTATQGRYDGSGNLVDLADPVERYAPTGEFQGNILVPGVNETEVQVNRLAIGVTDWFSVAVVFPFLISQKTDLKLDWEAGDFIPEFNRQMTGDDFWDWAGSLGQPKPPNWSAYSTPGDVILAVLVNLYRQPWSQVTVFAFGNTFTGAKANPEILGAIGSSGFDFITNGDIGFHLTSDWRLPDSVVDRFTLSFDLFYEHYLPREFASPVGKYNPLIVNYAPYIGPTYTVTRGDLYGIGSVLRYDVLRGPDEPSWLTRSNPEFQKALPALFAVQASYVHQRGFDTDYDSLSAVWDSDQEEDNKALYKHNFKFTGALSLLRYGVPVDIMGGYQTQTLIAGKNFRPTDGFEVGLRLYYSLLINPLDLIFGK
ncbi:MAG: hypothetical protein IPK07_08365 [Deltaproteobacteria bacterium]|nr:hypothetical protein [Deltaproteobacteria bacterium]